VVLKMPDSGEGEVDPVESLPQRVERYEASLIRDALRSTDGDVRATIAKLAIPRETFYDKIARATASNSIRSGSKPAHAALTFV
jgi:two-component system, NtrC family, C4-dicarboxylate transport response regulator DctD